MKKMAKEECSMGSCCGGTCGRCNAFTWLIVGLLLIANQYWFAVNAWVLIGAILVVLGVVKAIWPNCGHC